MALVVSSSSTSSANPTAALQVALVDFENILTSQELQMFRTHTQTAVQQKPDASTVMQFIAQLDAINHAQLMRSVAPRLSPLLEATRQFTGIVDTFVSSNPSVAALVWGGIKTAILAASNAAQYFDKVTTMIMALGKTLPAYREFASIYKDSIGLQCALSEYYATLIRLAMKIVEVSRRSQFAQLVSSFISPFESDFKTLQDQLIEASKLVKTRVSVAAAQLAMRESERNEEHRGLLRRFQSDFQLKLDELKVEKKRREAFRLKTSIQDQLSTIDHLEPWRQAQKRRLPNTAEWFKDEPAFHDWQAARGTSVLWCPGRMGIGKTILVSNIITVLFNSLQPNQVIAHHFCRAEHTSSLSARNILGTIARQLLHQHIETAENVELQKLHGVCKAINDEGIIDLLLDRLGIDQKYYIVIDGLDACDHSEINTIATGLDTLCRQHEREFHILLSGRPDLEQNLVNTINPKYQVQVSPSATKSDVSRYIDATLDYCLEQNRIRLTDPGLILKVADLLHKQYTDHFLFVCLFIEEICALGCENDISAALRNPPRQINDLLGRKLSRVQAESQAATAIKLLQFCGVTKRPLTTNEFGELLSIKILQPSLDRASIPWNLDQTITACHGLVHIDEENDTVEYVHHSVRQHFFAPTNTLPIEFTCGAIDLNLGQLCLTYLNFTDFSRQLTQSSVSSNKTITPLDIGLASMNGLPHLGNKVARKLLQSRTKLQQLSPRDLSRKMDDIRNESMSSQDKAANQTSSFYLLDYVKQFWVDHSIELNPGTGIEIWRIFCEVIDGYHDVAVRPWDSKNEKQPSSRNQNLPTLEWALKHRHIALLVDLVTRHKQILSEDQLRTYLRLDTSANHRYLTDNLLYHADYKDRLLTEATLSAEKGDVAGLEVFTQESESTGIILEIRSKALQVAAGGGHLEVVERLLAAQADVNAAAEYYGGRTALQAAAEGGHLEVVERLLAAQADVNADAKYYGGRTALQAAAEGGHLEVVERLLAAQADVNADAASNGGRTALQAAAEGGHIEVVELLLGAKADVNAAAAMDDRGRTALQAAAEGGHLEVVERLLTAKADVDAIASGYQRRTALHIAAGGGHLEVVERLLVAQADVNAAAGEWKGRTALHFAAEGGHLEVVERLLAAKADVNATASDCQDRTALQFAAEGGHLEVVERLLAAEADVNADAGIYGGGRTALQAAAGSGHLEVLERLLAAQADVNAAAKYYGGRTALQAAAEGGHLEVVERLLAAKANVNAVAARQYGRTALEAAEKGGHTQIVRILKKAGAKKSSILISQRPSSPDYSAKVLF